MLTIFKSVPSMTIAELKTSLKNRQMVLLDVRTIQEYRSGHIRGAKNVPLNHINTYQGDKEKLHLIICQSGMRSKQAAKFLQKQGYQVKNIRGGLNRWDGPLIGGKE